MQNTLSGARLGFSVDQNLGWWVASWTIGDDRRGRKVSKESKR